MAGFTYNINGGETLKFRLGNGDYKVLVAAAEAGQNRNLIDRIDQLEKLIA